MAPSTVRTVPPWIVQRPPQTLLPQHNSTPSDPRHGRGTPRDGHHDKSPRGSNSDNNGGIPNQDGNASGDGSSGDKLSASEGASAQSTSAGTARPMAPPPEPPTPPPNPNQPPPSVWNMDLSTLFRGKEGRKWDYLRSAEPVIVPQFHVVNRTWSIPPDEENLARRDSLAAGGGSRRPGNDGNLEAGDGADRYQQSWWYNPGTQWRSFIESSRYPRPRNEKSEVVSDDEISSDFGYRFFLNPRPNLGTNSPRHRQHPLGTLLRRGAGGGSSGGEGSGSGSDSRDGSGSKKSRFLYQRVWRTLLHHPLGPLACRLTVLSTSIVALAVAITIFRHEHLGHMGRGSDYLSQISRVAALDLLQERAQIIVAIVVDVVAVPYIGYITVDDYTGKPLGLRPPQDRIRLILLDLFFIILKSASTALGFEAMIYFVSDDGGNSDAGLMRTLAAFELMGLVSWAMTLTINIFREIERLGGR